MFYEDDTRTRNKDIYIEKIDGFMLWYRTDKNPDRIEGIPYNKIIRIEGMMENEKARFSKD